MFFSYTIPFCNVENLFFFFLQNLAASVGTNGVKYFIVKLVHTKNLDVSYVNRVWAFSTHTMPKVVQASREGKGYKDVGRVCE